MIPSAARPPIARRELGAAFAAALEAVPLTALVAPAGYGKTSLIDLTLGERGTSSARYTAQLWHAGEFAEPLAGEIRTVRPDFGRMTIALARQRPHGDDPVATAAWAQRLGARFAAELDHVREPLLIAIEDVHLLAGDRAFGEFLTGAMYALPTHVRLVLAGRTLPDFPLAAYLAGGRARVFGANDLRFEADDVIALAHRAGRRIDDAEAARLCAAYEGWPAGLALAVASEDRALPTPDGSLLARSAYLLRANVDALPPTLVAFLTETAAFETLHAALLERDETYGDVRAHFRECERRGVMLSVVKPGATYRLHPLLREALLERVRLRGGSRAVAALHARAGELLERARLVTAALFHLEAAGDGERLARFLQANAYDLFIAGLGERAGALARRLRDAGVDAPAAFALVEAMLVRQRGEPGAEEHLRTGIAAAETSCDALTAATMRHLLAEDRLARRTFLEPAELRELEIIGAARGEAGLTDAHTFAGWSLAIAGDFAGARERAHRALAHAGDDRVARARVASLDAYAATCLGAFDEANAMLDATLRAFEDGEHIVLLANTLVWYARCALLWGDVTAAFDYALQGERLARDLDLPAERAGVALALAEIHARRGERLGCERACEAARLAGGRAWYAADRERTPALVALFAGRAAFNAGDPAAALALIDAAAPADAHPEPQRAALLADRAAYAALAGRPHVAALVRAARDAAADAGAFDALDALHVNGAARIATALAGDAAPVVPRATIRSRFAGLIARRPDDDALLAALSPRAATASAGRTAPARTPAEPRGAALTKRENDILQLLAEGLTNKEIAQRFTLSPRTVDTHVERVLAKLNVTSRTRAVAAALRLGLVAQR
jgi:LuxR family maltose regulon positive regulatory protein